MWHIHFCSTNVDTLRRFATGFTGSDVQLDLRSSTSDFLNYDALYLSISAAEKLGIKLQPAEVAMVPRWSSLGQNFPPRILLGGVVQKGEPILSAHSSARVFESILRGVWTPPLATELDLTLGIIAEYFLTDEDLDAELQVRVLASTYRGVRQELV